MMPSETTSSPAIPLFQKAHARMVTLQRLDEQLVTLLEQRKRIVDELRSVQGQINEEFERVPTSGVIIKDPQVIQRGDLIEHGQRVQISGTVQREPGYTGLLFGHVNIEILDHDGYLIDVLAAALTLRSIPTTADRSSAFDITVQ